MGMDPWTKALEENDEIKNLRKLQTWPKHVLGTSELGLQGLSTSNGTYIISFTYEIHTNNDNQ